MAVSEQTPYVEHMANGVTTIFPLGFDCKKQDHLIINLDEKEATVGSWSLDIDNDTVTFNKAPSLGVLITIRRDMPLARSTDYKSYNNSFRPDPVNEDMDNIWLKMQELGVLNWLSNNNIKDLNEYVDSLNGETKEQFLAMIKNQGVSLNQLDDYYNYILGKLATISSDKDWDASFIAYNEKFTQQKINNGFESVAEMLAIINPKNGTRVYLKSYYKATNFALSTPYKGGNRHFTFDSTKALINNRGTIINGWISEEIIEHTPEMWGAYGDNDHDDADAINNMFRTLQPYPIGSNCKFSEIRRLLDYCKKYTVRLTSVYKHSKTIYIPCGITLVQPIDGRWNWDIGVGFNYQPVATAYDTAAVATIAYAFNNDAATIQEGSFKFVSDIYYTPTPAQFDSGKYVTLGWHVDLQGLSIRTNENVTLGLYLNGFFGKSDGISVGVASHPKVGIVSNLGWNTVHNYTFVTASQQAFVFKGVSTTNTLAFPLLNCRAGDVKTTDIVVPYKTASMNETGTIGITNINSLTKLISPCYQSWNIGIANVDGSILHSELPYFESGVCKYEYYNIASDLNVELSGYFGGYFYEDEIHDADGSIVNFKRAAVFLKDMGDGSTYNARFTGNVRFGVWRWIYGVGSSNCVELNVTNYLDSVTWGSLGDLYLIKKANFGDTYKTVYIDELTGNDENFGFSANKPRRSLTNIDILGRTGVRKAIVTSDLNIPDQLITLSEDLHIVASPIDYSLQIKLESGRFSLGSANVTFEGFSIKSTEENGTHMFYMVGANTKSNLKLLCNINYNNSLVYCSAVSEIDLAIISYEVVVPKYITVAEGEYCIAGVSASYNSQPPASISTGNVLFKYKNPPTLI